MPLKLKISPAFASSQLETHMKRRSRPASRSSPTRDAHMCPVYSFYLLEEHQQMHCSFDGNTHAASMSASVSLLLLQDVAHGCNLQTLQAFPRARLKCSGPGQTRACGAQFYYKSAALMSNVNHMLKISIESNSHSKQFINQQTSISNN